MVSPNLKHRGPAQTRVLDKQVILLRKVNPQKMGRGGMEMLALTNLAPGEAEGDKPWFLDNYVACEHPRSLEMSRALLGATTGFAIARVDTGEILKEFDATTEQYQVAAKVAENVSVRQAIDIAVGEEEEAAEAVASARSPKAKSAGSTPASRATE